MIDARKTYEALLENVDSLLADVRQRVEVTKVGAPATLDDMTTRVEESLKQSEAACSSLRKSLKDRSKAREYKVAMAKRILSLSQQLAA